MMFCLPAIAHPAARRLSGHRALGALAIALAAAAWPARAVNPEATFWSFFVAEDGRGGTAEAYRYDPRGTVRLYVRCHRDAAEAGAAIQATVVVPKALGPAIRSLRVEGMAISSEKLDQPAVFDGRERRWHDDAARAFDFTSSQDEGRRLLAFVYRRHAANFLARPLPPETERDAYRGEQLFVTLMGDGVEQTLRFRLSGSGGIAKLAEACGIEEVGNETD